MDAGRVPGLPEGTGIAILGWLAFVIASVVIGGAVGAAVPLLWRFLMHDYQRQRVLTMLDPTQDPLGTGWNIIQSKTAIGSGGLSGKGWMEGTQSRLDFLPEGHTDFIIAVMSEEFGLLGVMLLLAIYAMVIIRGLMIAVNSQNSFGRLLAAAHPGRRSLSSYF